MWMAAVKVQYCSLTCCNIWKRHTDGLKQSRLLWKTTLFTRTKKRKTGSRRTRKSGDLSTGFLPRINHVKRLWQALQDYNHKERSIWQLLKKVRHFMKTVNPSPRRKTWSGKSAAVLGATI